MPAAWHEGLDARVKQPRGAHARRCPSRAFLIVATRLGGRHGYDAAGATSVMGGAVTGFAKALHRERPDALIKAVDFAASRKTAEPADLLIAEVLHDAAAYEIGYADGLRWTVAVIEQELHARRDAARQRTPRSWSPARRAASSRRSPPTSPRPRRAPRSTCSTSPPPPRRTTRTSPRWPPTATGSSSRSPTACARPARSRRRSSSTASSRASSARPRRATAIDAIERAGGSAHWHAVDLTSATAVEQALAGLDGADVVIHAAGLDISHPLASKSQAEYDLVFDVKADGWFNLLHALAGKPIGTVVAFSSIAGRFGNAAQTDYAAANDLLCKAVSNLCAGGTRAIAIDWTAWAEIGMASRGSIPKVMAAAGIAMLPPAVGVPAVRRELEASPGGEVVVAGALGVLLSETPQPITITAGPISASAATVTINGGLEIQTELDPAHAAFLDDHRIDGTAVLPGVMGMEAFAETAAALAPGYEIVGLEDVELQAPFKFYRDEPRTLRVCARVEQAADGRLAAHCELIGRRTLAGGEVQETRHFSGRVMLAREAEAAPRSEVPPELPAGAVVEHDAVYRVYFHGPAYQVLEQAYRSDGHVLGRFAGDLPPHTEPGAGSTRIVPRLIELCFQTAGVLELGHDGVMGLPTHVDRVTRFAGADAPGRLTAIVAPRPDDNAVDAEVVDEQGTVRIRLEGYRTTALPADFTDEALAPLRAVVA